MLMLVELMATLLLGFVIGRVWEIRQQILRANPVGNRPRRVDGGIAAQGSEQLQVDDRRLLATLDRQMKDLITSAVGQRPNTVVREASRRGPIPHAKNP